MIGQEMVKLPPYIIEEKKKREKKKRKEQERPRIDIPTLPDQEKTPDPNKKPDEGTVIIINPDGSEKKG